MSVGISLLKNPGLGGSCQIGIQHYQLGELLGQLLKRIAIAFTSCDFLDCVCHYA
jgi:hypothetical protein